MFKEGDVRGRRRLIDVIPLMLKCDHDECNVRVLRTTTREVRLYKVAPQVHKMYGGPGTFSLKLL